MAVPFLPLACNWCAALATCGGCWVKRRSAVTGSTAQPLADRRHAQGLHPIDTEPAERAAAPMKTITIYHNPERGNRQAVLLSSATAAEPGDRVLKTLLHQGPPG